MALEMKLKSSLEINTEKEELIFNYMDSNKFVDYLKERYEIKTYEYSELRII